MGDLAWRGTLAALNLVVAALNLNAFRESHEARDWVAAIAWLGSGSYWVWQACHAL